MENLENLLSSPQSFNEPVFNDELFKIADELTTYGEVWATTEEVTPTLYELTRTRVEYVTTLLDTKVPLPVYEAYQGDTKQDAISLTIEGISSIVTAVLAAIRKFLKWVFDSIFRSHKKYKRNKSVLKDVDTADNADIERVIDQIAKSNLDSLNIKVIGGRLMVEDLDKQPKDTKTVIKLISNIGSILVRCMGPHPRLDTLSTQYDTLVREYHTMVKEHDKYISTVSAKVVEIARILLKHEPSQDTAVNNKVYKTIDDIIKDIGDLVNTDNVPIKKVDTYASVHMISATTSRYGPLPGSQIDSGFYYSAKVAAPIIAPRNTHTLRAESSSTLSQINLIIFDKVVTIDESKNPKYKSFATTVESGIKGISNIIAGMMRTPVRDFTALDKELDKLNDTSFKAGNSIKDALADIDKHVKKIGVQPTSKFTGQHMTIYYKHLLNVSKLLTYWYAAKAGSVQVINNKAESLVIRWIV